MPLKEVPSVRTLDELYRIHKRHQLHDPAKDLSAEEQERQRYAWFLGASAVILTMLVLCGDDEIGHGRRSVRTAVLEAWDAEIMDAAVAAILANEAKQSGGSEEPRYH